MWHYIYNCRLYDLFQSEKPRPFLKDSFLSHNPSNLHTAEGACSVSQSGGRDGRMLLWRRTVKLRSCCDLPPLYSYTCEHASECVRVEAEASSAALHVQQCWFITSVQFANADPPLNSDQCVGRRAASCVGEQQSVIALNIQGQMYRSYAENLQYFTSCYSVQQTNVSCLRNNMILFLKMWSVSFTLYNLQNKWNWKVSETVTVMIYWL